jgi:hypothetical protein
MRMSFSEIMPIGFCWRHHRHTTDLVEAHHGRVSRTGSVVLATFTEWS